MFITVKLNNDWDTILADEWEKPYYINLHSFLKAEYSGKTIYPPMHDIFNSLRYTSFENTKVVIIGQDPYHEFGQAHGLCFSVRKGVQIPPSLLNIYKELNRDLGFVPPEHGDLTRWAQNGVLLLNSVLTVREGAAGSHRAKGWETFTDRAIELLNQRKEPIVFLLWGNYARAKKALITNPNHLVLETVHPSPLSASRGFIGCGHFSKCNAFLGENAIDWNLE